MTGTETHGPAMKFLAIDRRTFRIIAIAAAPLELVAFVGLLYICPIDVGCATGTSPWWVTYVTAGIYVHLPALLLRLDAVALFSRAAFLSLVFLVGYADLFLAITLVTVGCRSIAKVIPTLGAPAAQSHRT